MLTIDLGRSFRCVGLSRVWGCGGASPKPLGSRGWNTPWGLCATRLLPDSQATLCSDQGGRPVRLPRKLSRLIQLDPRVWPISLTMERGARDSLHFGGTGNRVCVCEWVGECVCVCVCRCWHRYSTSKHLWNLSAHLWFTNTVLDLKSFA